MYMRLFTVEQSLFQVLEVGPLDQMKSRDGGLIVPLEGRSLSRFDQLTLQYLYWNTCGKHPVENYAELIRNCIEEIKTKFGSTLFNQAVESVLYSSCSKDLTNQTPSIRRKTMPQVEAVETAAAVEKTPRVEQNGVARPKHGTATGRVWQIADDASAAAGAPAKRKVVIDTAVGEGINVATAATQFSNWCKFHGIAKEVKAPVEKAPKVAKEKKAKKSDVTVETEATEANAVINGEPAIVTGLSQG